MCYVREKLNMSGRYPLIIFTVIFVLLVFSRVNVFSLAAINN